MLKIVLVGLFCCYLVSAAPVEEKPDPYSFTYETADEEGNKSARQESGDASGVVQGSYSYIDKNGLTRTVQYVADDDGFRASINSNEPGVISSAPASATYSVQ